MTETISSTIVVNDASCLFDLKKAGLLHLLMQLPCVFLIPFPVRFSELLDFDLNDWNILDDGGMITFDLSPEQVGEAILEKAKHPKLSVYDCFCLVTARHHNASIILTGDKQLRNVALQDGCNVRGVLWVIDELIRLKLCEISVIKKSLEIWRDDLSVFLPKTEIEKRLKIIDI